MSPRRGGAAAVGAGKILKLEGSGRRTGWEPVPPSQRGWLSYRRAVPVQCPATPRPPLQSHPGRVGRPGHGEGTRFPLLVGFLWAGTLQVPPCPPRGVWEGAAAAPGAIFLAGRPAPRHPQGVGDSPLSGNGVSPLKPKAISLGWERDAGGTGISRPLCRGRCGHRSPHLLRGGVVSAAPLPYFRFSNISAPTV